MEMYIAMDYLGELPLSFSLEDLKKAFKRQCLIFHPDYGGTHEDFLNLKESFEFMKKFASKKEIGIIEIDKCNHNCKNCIYYDSWHDSCIKEKD